MSYIHDAIYESHKTEDEIALNKIKNPPELKRPKMMKEQKTAPEKPLKESVEKIEEKQPYKRSEYEESLLSGYRKYAHLDEDFEITEDNLSKTALKIVACRNAGCSSNRVRCAVLGIPWEDDFEDGDYTDFEPFLI